MNIMLVDDDQSILNSMEILLGSDKEIQIIAKALNGQEAIKAIKKNHPDIILMDIRMPVMNGIEAVAQIKKDWPYIKIIMLTTFKDFSNIHQALHAGADGYLLKTDDLEKQIKTIKAVYEGHAIISEEALKTLTGKQQDESLSPRENDVVELIAYGYSNKEIAKRLFIGEGTVRNVISVILDKLYLRDRTQIAIYYWQTKSDSKSP